MQHAELIANLENTFNGSPWYGEAVLEMLDRISPAQSAVEIGGRSIRRTVEHLLAWRRFVLEHLAGNSEYDLYNEADDWPNHPEYAWGDLLNLLRTNQQQLLEALRNFPPERLADQVPVRTYNYEFLIQGIVQHDVYHLGQIGLLLALQND